jgi:hypothetical protein
MCTRLAVIDGFFVLFLVYVLYPHGEDGMLIYTYPSFHVVGWVLRLSLVGLSVCTWILSRRALASI